MKEELKKYDEERKKLLKEDKKFFDEFQPTNQQREGWEEGLQRISRSSAMTTGQVWAYNSDIKLFIKETLENELHERDKDWQKLMKETLATERERMLGEIEKKIIGKVNWLMDTYEYEDDSRSREAHQVVFLKNILSLINSLKSNHD